ncbi:unnamed protein product [Albugo candida]|uniref:CCHC-type domain-containing protein n=1 Tax=Albugo candida TaxID=65357 RepID=A0A024GMQ9_9STRA|nr:unnamed protein product [Albugo candida]|eukprot:CCI48058.1 unnamed protein product [Albugo candida]
MQCLHQCFQTTITQTQATKLLTARKDPKRSWPEHFLYLVASSDARSGAEALVLKNIVQYASPDLSHVLMAKYDDNRMDYLLHAEELAHFAQAIKTGVRGGKATGKDVLLHVGEYQPRNDIRTCYNCNKFGHIALNCRGNKKEKGHERGVYMTLSAVDDREIVQDQWILGSIDNL